MDRPTPPRLLARAVSWMLPESDRDHVLLELGDLYITRERRKGRLRARWWYAKQAVSFACRLTADRLRSRLGRLHMSLADSCRRGWDVFRIDIGYGARQLARSPVFTLVSVASLAVGIGVVVGGLSALSTFLTPPPYRDADRLFRIYSSDMARSRALYHTTSWSVMEEIEGSGVFGSVAARLDRNPTLTLAWSGRTPRTERVRIVSANYFETLGMDPVRGRWFQEGGTDPEIVLAHRTWQGLLDAGLDVVGQSVLVSGVETAVVGVAPPWLEGSAWLPAGRAGPLLGEAGLLTDRSRRGFELVGRLRPGVTREAAEARLERLAVALAAAYPGTRMDVDGAPRRLSLLSLRESLIPPGDRLLVLGVLSGVAFLFLLVLLIACTNVAGLTLARAMARRHEIGVRLTLGASARRLLAQLLTESALLALLGGGAGAAAAFWTLELLSRDPELAALGVHLDWGIAVAVALVTLSSAILFGLAPALQTIRSGAPAGVSSTHTSSPGLGRLGGTVISVQVASSFVLILLASVALLGLRSLTQGDPGFDVGGLLVARPMAPELAADTARARRYVEDLVGAAERQPGVRHVGIAWHVPFGGSGSGSRVEMPNGDTFFVGTNAVAGAYFETLGIPLLRGRYLRDTDRAGNPVVTVVNRTFARTLGDDVLGTRVDIGSSRGVRIVGIVEDAWYHRVAEEARPFLYLPLAQRQGVGGFPADHFPGLLVRAASPDAVASVASGLERALRGGYAEFAPPHVESLSAMMAARAEPQRLASRAALGAGVVELLLAGIGLYGILVFTLLARTRELGVRLALGALPRQAGWAVLRRGLRWTVLGVVCGAALGVPAMMVAERAMLGARADDPLPFLIALAAVTLATLAAAVPPAVRAARVRPGVALRHE